MKIDDFLLTLIKKEFPNDEDLTIQEYIIEKFDPVYTKFVSVHQGECIFYCVQSFGNRLVGFNIKSSTSFHKPEEIIDWFFVERQQTVITTYPKINEQ